MLPKNVEFWSTDLFKDFNFAPGDLKEGIARVEIFNLNTRSIRSHLMSQKISSLFSKLDIARCILKTCGVLHRTDLIRTTKIELCF